MTTELELLKEIETPFEYVGKSEIVTEFLAAQVALDRARQQLQEAQAKLIMTVQELSGKVDGNDQFRDDVISYLYWFHPDVKPTEISEAFGMRKGARRSPVKTKLLCKWCNEPLTVTSRDSLKAEIHSYSAPLGGLHDGTHYGADWATTCQHKYSLWLDAQRDPEKKKRTEAEERRMVELQTMAYREYLQTAEWQETRKAALKRAHYKCQLCNGQGLLNVHHKTYENRGRELNTDLIVLCEDCHAKFHDKLP